MAVRSTAWDYPSTIHLSNYLSYLRRIRSDILVGGATNAVINTNEVLILCAMARPLKASDTPGAGSVAWGVDGRFSWSILTPDCLRG